MLSYNIEQAVEEVRRNLITVLMRECDLDVQGAMNRAHEYHREIQRKFIGLLDKVPSFGVEVDNAVSDHIFHLGNWPPANMYWSYEGARYFGDKGLDVLRDGCVDLFPKVKTYPEVKSM